MLWLYERYIWDTKCCVIIEPWHPVLWGFSTTLRVSDRALLSSLQLWKSPADLCYGLSCSNIELFCKLNIAASWIHFHICRCSQNHLSMLLQSPTALYCSPAVPGSICELLESPVWLTRVPRLLWCGFLTDLYFADDLTVPTRFLSSFHCVPTILSAQWNICQRYIGSLPPIVYPMWNMVFYGVPPEVMNFVKIFSLQPPKTSHIYLHYPIYFSSSLNPSNGSYGPSHLFVACVHSCSLFLTFIPPVSPVILHQLLSRHCSPLLIWAPLPLIVTVWDHQDLHLSCLECVAVPSWIVISTHSTG